MNWFEQNPDSNKLGNDIHYRGKILTLLKVKLAYFDLCVKRGDCTPLVSIFGLD